MEKVTARQRNKKQQQTGARRSLVPVKGTINLLPLFRRSPMRCSFLSAHVSAPFFHFPSCMRIMAFSACGFNERQVCGNRAAIPPGRIAHRIHNSRPYPPSLWKWIFRENSSGLACRRDLRPNRQTARTNMSVIVLTNDTYFFHARTLHRDCSKAIDRLRRAPLDHFYRITIIYVLIKKIGLK